MLDLYKLLTVYIVNKIKHETVNLLDIKSVRLVAVLPNHYDHLRCFVVSGKNTEP